MPVDNVAIGELDRQLGGRGDHRVSALAGWAKVMPFGQHDQEARGAQLPLRALFEQHGVVLESGADGLVFFKELGLGVVRLARRWLVIARLPSTISLRHEFGEKNLTVHVLF
mgnify:CR=1 FL=1